MVEKRQSMFSIREFLVSFAVSLLRELKTPNLWIWPPISSQKRMLFKCKTCIRTVKRLKIAPRMHQKSPFKMQNPKNFPHPTLLGVFGALIRAPVIKIYGSAGGTHSALHTPYSWWGGVGYPSQESHPRFGPCWTSVPEWRNQNLVTLLQSDDLL